MEMTREELNDVQATRGHDRSDEIRLQAEVDRLRDDYPGGDQEAQALAWSAVYKRCRDLGMPNFYKATGREGVLAFISERAAARPADDAERASVPTVTCLTCPNCGASSLHPI